MAFQMLIGFGVWSSAGSIALTDHQHSLASRLASEITEIVQLCREGNAREETSRGPLRESISIDAAGEAVHDPHSYKRGRRPSAAAPLL